MPIRGRSPRWAMAPPRWRPFGSPELYPWMYSSLPTVHTPHETAAASGEHEAIRRREARDGREPLQSLLMRPLHAVERLGVLVRRSREASRYSTPNFFRAKETCSRWGCERERSRVRGDGRIESAGCLRVVDAAAAADAIGTVSGNRLGDAHVIGASAVAFRSESGGGGSEGSRTLMLPKMVVRAPPMAMSAQPYSEGICMICLLQGVRRASRSRHAPTNDRNLPKLFDETANATAGANVRRWRRPAETRKIARCAHCFQTRISTPPLFEARRADAVAPRASSRHAVGRSPRP